MFYGGEKGGVFFWILVTGVKYKGKGMNLGNLRSKVWSVLRNAGTY